MKHNEQDDLILKKAQELELFFLQHKIMLWGAAGQVNTFERNPSYKTTNSFWKAIFPSFYNYSREILNFDKSNPNGINLFEHFIEVIKTHSSHDERLLEAPYYEQVKQIEQLIKTSSMEMVDLMESALYQKIYLNKELQVANAKEEALNKPKGKI